MIAGVGVHLDVEVNRLPYNWLTYPSLQMVWSGAAVQYLGDGPVGALTRGPLQFLQSPFYYEDRPDVG